MTARLDQLRVTLADRYRVERARGGWSESRRLTEP